MAIDFPASPTLNQTFSSGNVNYIWDGTKWTASVTGGISLDKIEKGNTKAEVVDTGSDGRFVVTTEGSERLRVDSSGRVGIGNTTPSYLLDLLGSAPRIRVEDFSTGAAFHHFKNNSGNFYLGIDNSTGGSLSAGNYARVLWSQGAYPLVFATNDTQRAQIDSSGRLLVGTSSSPSVGNGQYARIVVQGYTGDATGAGDFSIQRGEAAATITSGEDIGWIRFNDSAGYSFAQIGCLADANAGTNDYPGRLVFSTTADGASSPTERMRITSGGSVFIGKTSGAGQGNVLGIDLGTNQGQALFVTGSTSILYLNRNTDDGDLVRFAQGGTDEGTISVSGTTVSYNGAHLSRWSQLPSGSERTEILRGTVLSNIDEMCEWGDEENEQLNRMKVSDVEGDKNVSGVFQAWDDDDDTYTNDFYCAMTGDFIIRIAQGVTVERGDLLMSAGNGTAKPQDDDIIRSKTIAKVTSTNVSCTYDDGSYCVPCVLMAC